MPEGLLEKYKHIRQTARSYLSPLVSATRHPEADPRIIGKMLGLYREGKMYFQSETEVSILMDFTIAERLYDGKSLVDLELESGVALDPDQRSILEAFRASHTSLFEVLDTDSKAHSMLLYDLLRDEDKQIVDINLSRSADNSKLLFFRLIDLEEFAMTSGVSFAFSSKTRISCSGRYRTELRSRFTIDKSITRFLIFHRLNRQFGHEIELI